MQHCNLCECVRDLNNIYGNCGNFQQLTVPKIQWQTLTLPQQQMCCQSLKRFEIYLLINENLLCAAVNLSVCECVYVMEKVDKNSVSVLLQMS